MLSINISELIWGIINFFLLYFLLRRFLYTPVISFVEKRNERIKAGLDEEKAALSRQQEQSMELEELCKSRQLQAEELLRQAGNEAEMQRSLLLHRAREEANAAQLSFAENEALLCEEKRNELSAFKAELAQALADRVLG